MRLSGFFQSSRCWAFLPAVVATACLFPLAASAETTLRYQFRAGESTRYVMTQSMTMKMQLPQSPTPVTTRMTQKMYLTVAVTELLPDGSARQKQTIDRMSMSLTSEGGPVPQDFQYDSASDQEPEGPLAAVILKSLKPMVGAEWLQTVSPRGEISDVEVPEKVVAALKANPGASMMGSMATPEGLKQLSSQAAMNFPMEAVKAGDNWSTQIDVKLPFGTMVTKKITTYSGPGEDALERLKLSTDIEFVPTPNSPAEIKLNENMSEGEVLFDNRIGQMNQSRLKQTMNMTVTVAGQSIDQIVSTEVDFRPLKEEAEGKPSR